MSGSPRQAQGVTASEEISELWVELRYIGTSVPLVENLKAGKGYCRGISTGGNLGYNYVQ